MIRLLSGLQNRTGKGRRLCSKESALTSTTIPAGYVDEISFLRAKKSDQLLTAPLSIDCLIDRIYIYIVIDENVQVQLSIDCLIDLLYIYTDRRKHAGLIFDWLIAWLSYYAMYKISKKIQIFSPVLPQAEMGAPSAADQPEKEAGTPYIRVRGPLSAPVHKAVEQGHHTCRGPGEGQRSTFSGLCEKHNQTAHVHPDHVFQHFQAPYATIDATRHTKVNNLTIPHRILTPIHHFIQPFIFSNRKGILAIPHRILSHIHHFIQPFIFSDRKGRNIGHSTQNSQSYSSFYPTIHLFRQKKKIPSHFEIASVKTS